MCISRIILEISHFLFILLLHFICAFQYSSAEGLPRKIDISNDKRIIFAHVKEHLELKCPIERTDESDIPIFIDWLKGDIALYNEKGYTITNKGFLKIKSVTKEHAGTYTCEGINGYGFVRVNLTVIVEDSENEVVNRTLHYQNSASRVYGFPPIIKKRPSTKLVHDVGGQATFHCVASGKPTPHIFFFKDGELFEDTQIEISNGLIHSTLHVKDLKKSDAGVYKCIARNKIGEDEVDYTLHVSDPSYPPAITSLEPSSVTVKEGATAVFWCEVKSKPGLKLHIKWLKRLNKKEMGDPMTLDDVTLFRSGKTYYRPLNLSDGVGTNGIYKSKLTLQNVFKEDSGIYVCLALNDKGYNVKNVTLTVISTAKPLSAPSYILSRSTSIVATIIIALVVAVAALMLFIHFYCKGKSHKNNPQVIKSDCEDPSPLPTNLKKQSMKDQLTYTEIKDLHSKVQLLCGDTNYSCDHMDHPVTRTMQVKSYLP